MTDFDHRALRARILAGAAEISCNDGVDALMAQSLADGNTRLTADGALAATTGVFTGRSVKDKFIVRDAGTADRIWWASNQPMRADDFDALLADFELALRQKELFLQELHAGADPDYRLDVTVITESAWHALFIRNLLIRPKADDPASPTDADVTILHLPSFRADPGRHGTRTDTVIALDLSRRLILIGGTSYAGEIKKSVFSLFNYLAPARGVLPMHCSANVGGAGDVALLFGLSGTGKTTLSNDPARLLIGDDEHAWTPGGVFNLEGGCYAKTIRLDATAEPEIYAAARRPGTVLENVVVDPATRLPDFDDASLTENSRAAYPLEALPAIYEGGVAAPPKTVVFLTCDAFGVLPPLAKLTPKQAVYHFLSGYTAKVAGTERGVTEPQATFSACFGAPFMPLRPEIYGGLLEERLRETGATVWLLNTGWIGGPYGVGRRIDIATTRRLLNAALSGALDEAETRTDPVFGLAVPVAVDGVAQPLLQPRESWPDRRAYDKQAERLASLFAENIRRFDAADERPVELALAG